MVNDDTLGHDHDDELPAFDEHELKSDPLEQFSIWYEAVMESGLPEPTAMTLATATAAGMPSARVVLLKSFDRRGFVFHTNYESRKGLELAENPRAALVLFWQPLHRQIRIEGAVERISSDESDAYFESRPRAARLGAIASVQTARATSRAEIEARFERLKRELAGKPVRRPANWGGLRVVPTAFEFWQGRDNRLHDRFRFTSRPDDSWQVERLWP